MGYVSAPLTEETFPDGSRLVHTEDGGWLILESDLAARNVVGLAHDLQALALEEATEAGAEEVVVVDEQDAQLLELLPGAPILGG